MSNQPYSMLILGPSGAGKSSFVRSAVNYLGPSAIALAPGMDEANSYLGLSDRLTMRGFDDTDYMPSLGLKATNGFVDLLKWQKGVLDEVRSDVEAGKEPRYKLFAQDTVTAMGRLVVAATMSATGRTSLPAGISPDGAAFYGLLQQKFDELFRIPRALKGYGVHWISTGHVSEKEVKESANAQVGEGNKVTAIVPAIMGGYRDILPSFFDLVLHAGVVKKPQAEDVHFLRWKPSGKRPTKSRLGALSVDERLPNDFPKLIQLIEAATDAKS